MFAPSYDDTVIHTELPHPRKTIYSKYIKRLLSFLKRIGAVTGIYV